jgi:hypothetical protein
LPAVRHAILELSLDYRRSDARIVENGFATSGGLSKSAQSSATHKSTTLIDVCLAPTSGVKADIS